MNGIESLTVLMTSIAALLCLLLPSSTGQGLQISAQLVRRDGQIFYNLLFENNSQIPLDGFMIQFNKNMFGLATAGPLQVPQLQPGNISKDSSAYGFIPERSPCEDGRMERATFLETWKSLPDSNEVLNDFPGIIVNSVEATLNWLVALNMFFIAKRKHANQEVLYLSAKIPRGIPFLIELTAVIGVPVLKCAIKTPNPEIAPLFFEAIETLLKN
ncbi:hypothetical protein U1Q18_019286 [Sarracenia purpurea var. burkii]